MAVATPGSGTGLITSLVGDLRSETAELRGVLSSLTEDDWTRQTPAAGWTVLDQITHLAYFDDVTRASLTDPDRFRAEAAELVAGGEDFPDRIARQFHDMAPSDLLTWFDRSRARLITAFQQVDPAARLPWFGPSMSPASSVTARLMETWAHGQDVLDTMDVARTPTARLRHIADLGVRALRYAYGVNGLEVPHNPIRVELAGPDGQRWDWGPQDASDRVTGDALEFCLVVTQRRHRDDTSLQVTGATAKQWIVIAQAFAGPAGPGRAPGAVHTHTRPHATAPATAPQEGL
ncbi:TIGR03084 family metal-binding protein [Streptomyces muensis]|uniref:TIGR03084 family metal-binding protein n=1 Tax=Streptomyces muensis TaxID=1077944 RepID=A0A9X1PRR3_STRM4|nr:TIGR03084 family metal-binding protein [Streptomyces muensis]MCF1592312.1 TIGR03084 family metal-binding protein [Streptomyces muensis]